ncbi:SOS response-associated peptidase [Xanthobacteraceae bacterium A53D]
MPSTPSAESAQTDRASARGSRTRKTLSRMRGLGLAATPSCVAFAHSTVEGHSVAIGSLTICFRCPSRVCLRRGAVHRSIGVAIGAANRSSCGMCGRFSQSQPPSSYAAFFTLDQAVPLPNAAPRYNVAPTQQAQVIRFNPQTQRAELSVLRWGLVPSFAPDISRAASLINARSEGVSERTAFRAAWRKPRRCIVPAEAFYEWQPGSTPRQPYAIGLKSGAPMGLAGLWEGWKDPASGEWLRTFTILTCAANPLLAPLHERMPVILEPAQMADWLTAPDPAPLLRSYPAEAMTLWPVSTRVNAVRNDDADLLKPQEPAEPEAPTLF